MSSASSSPIRHSNTRTIRREVVALTIPLFLLSPGVVESTQNHELPTGREIMDRYLEVTGGLEALAKLNNRVTTATMEMKGMGLKATITTYQARPNKMYTSVQIPNIGTIERGTDGSVFWEKHPFMGLRIMEGKERALMLLLARFDEADYQKVYESVECVGVEEVAGEACYKVILTPKEAEPLCYYFSKRSGLLVKSEFTLEAPLAGQINVETLLSDYKEIDRVLWAHKAVETTKLMVSHITTERIEHNVMLPADRFDLPAEVREKLRESKEGKPTSRLAHAVEDGSFNSDGVQIHYTVQGKGAAVVLIHGFAGSMLEWKACGIGNLLSHDYKVIALDARGHGASDKPEGVDQYGTKMIDDVVRLLDHLNIDKAHVAGYSMGGLIVFKMAAMRPERMNSGIIVDVGWIKAGSEHAKEFQNPPDRIPKGALGDCFRGMREFMLTADQIKAVEVPLLFLLAEKDVWAESEKPLKSIRSDLGIIIIEEANHGSVMFKPKFKEAFKAFIGQHTDSG